MGYLTTFGALKLNRDQVMTFETWLQIHTNVCNFVTFVTSPKSPKPYKLFKIVFSLSFKL